MAISHEDLYKRLRWSTLSRHYAIGRWWRTNYFTCGNYLGERPLPASGSELVDCDGKWDRPIRNGQPLFTNIDNIRDNPALSNERWRVISHDRTNSQLMTGLRLVSLCVEHQLGNPDARPLIKLTLATLASLFKFTNPDGPFAGYILRWDPATTDAWTVKIDAKGHEDPQVCCEFLVNPNGKNYTQSHYLYCTPFDDPRYVRAKAIGHKDRLRRWEPSMDEYTGLIAGLFMIFVTFKDDASGEAVAMVSEVKRLIRLVGKYLQRVGYLLVRPDGGSGPRSFVARGAAGPNPCYEYAFARVFQRVVGDSFNVPSSATFEDAMHLAGLDGQWNRSALISFPLALHALTSSPVWPRLQTIFGQDPMATLNQQLGDDAKQTVMQAAQVAMNLDAYDIAYDEDRTEFVVARILKKICLNSPRRGFELFMRVPKHDGDWADFHKVLIGLTSLDDSDHVVRDEYLRWYDVNILPFFQQAGQDEIVGPESWCLPTLATAVAALLREDDPIKRAVHELRLTSDLGAMRKTLENTCKNDSPLYTDGSECEAHDDTSFWFGYMAPLTVTWLHQLRLGSNVVREVPRPTAASIGNWPKPFVPGAVIKAAHVDRMPIPLAALRRGPVPNQNEGDVLLFADADPVPKPSDNSLGAVPPPQMGQPTVLSQAALPLVGPNRRVFTLPLPPLTLNGWRREDYTCVPIRKIDSQTNALIASERVDGNNYLVEVRFNTSVIPWRPANFRATFTLSWVKQV